MSFIAQNIDANEHQNRGAGHNANGYFRWVNES